MGDLLLLVVAAIVVFLLGWALSNGFDEPRGEPDAEVASRPDGQSSGGSPMTQDEQQSGSRTPGLLTRAFRFVIGGATVDIEAARKELRVTRKKAPKVHVVKDSIRYQTELLDRILSAKQAIDTKAALIVPAIGIIGGVAADQVAPSLSWQAQVLGGVAILFAAFAVGFAVLTVVAREQILGAGSVFMAFETSAEDLADYYQRISNALALSVLSANRLVWEKAARYNRSLLCAAIAVILLLAFIAFGGWRVTLNVG